MAGGASDVLERVIGKKGRPKPGLHGGEEYHASKGAYYANLLYDTHGKRERFELYHYGTLILSVNYKHKDITGGWHTTSSSGAINKALNMLKVPCFWTRADKGHGFWCRGGWKGTPNGPVEKKKAAVKHAQMIKTRAAARRAARPGGLFKIPGRRYSKLAVRKMADLLKDYLGSN
jgi:hypothetical protein